MHSMSEMVSEGGRRPRQGICRLTVATKTMVSLTENPQPVGFAGGYSKRSS